MRAKLASTVSPYGEDPLDWSLPCQESAMIKTFLLVPLCFFSPILMSCDVLTHYVVVENESKKTITLLQKRIYERDDGSMEALGKPKSFKPGERIKKIELTCFDVFVYKITTDEGLSVEVTIPALQDVADRRMPLSIKVLEE